MNILAVTGLKREARIISGPNVTVLACGGHDAALRTQLERTIAGGVRGIISIGIGGGLSPHSKPGDIVIASEVVTLDRRFGTDSAWYSRMLALLPNAFAAPIMGSEAMIATARAKEVLFRDTGAYAADMESHIAAELAEKHRIAFVALRIIADAAHRDLPRAARVALKPDGAVNIAAVLRSVATRPGQIPGLIRVARDTETALKVLLRCRRRLGLGLAGADFA